MTPDVQAALIAIGNAFTANARKQRIETFNTLNRLAEKKAIILVGDSLTEGFPIQEMYRSFIPIYNRGIGGDTTRDVLNRLQVSIFDLEPRKVFLWIGTNDLAVEQGEVIGSIVKRIKEICGSIHTRLPQTQIYLLSICPVNTTHDPKIQLQIVANRTNADIQALNALLKQLADGMEITYIDLYTPLADSEGSLRIVYTTEGLHLNAEGYCVVLSILKDFFDDQPAK